MKKTFIGLFFLLFLGTFLFSQKKELTIDQAVVGQFRELAPKRNLYLRFLENSNNYYYPDFAANVYMQGKAGEKAESILVKLEDINKAIARSGLKELERIPLLSSINNEQVFFSVDSFYVFYDIKLKKIIKKFPYYSDAENIKYYQKADILVFTLVNNLYISTSEQKIIPITKYEDKGIVCGQPVHREEFGISSGYFFANKGNYLAFYRMDETMVTDYPLVNINERVAETKLIKYPMAGMKSHEVTIGIYDIKNKTIKYIDTGEPKEQYLTNICWSPDDKYLYVAVLNREQNHLKFKEYNIENGKYVKTLFEEENLKYVEPLNPSVFLNTNNDKFVWESQRDGYNHVYLYNTNGDLIKQVTSGNWVVTKIFGICPNDEYLYYESTEESPLQRHIYRVNLNTLEKLKLTNEKGTHNAVFNSDFSQFIDSYSSIETPFVQQVRANDGSLLAAISKAENPLQDFNISEIEIVTIIAADNVTPLYGRLIKPINLESGKKYPVVVYVYGGPHAQLVSDSWLGGGALWEQYMAQRGYGMLILDNRGSAYRGFEFESVLHKEMGVNEVKDQYKGIEFLRQLDWVDHKRIGVHGWSYGGFMAISMMMEHSDVFKVGVAGGPVTDWKYYEVMYGERYMSTPQKNAEGYAKTSLLNKINKLNGKLLVIHGYQDNIVVPQHALTFVDECIKQRKQVDLFFYPNHEHNVRGFDRIHLMQKVSDYFDTWLK